MTGEELLNKLNYYGMEKSIRQLVMDEELAPIEKLAVMTNREVCDLVVKKYQLVYSESDEIGLVKNEDAEEVFGKIKIIAR